MKKAIKKEIEKLEKLRSKSFDLWNSCDWACLSYQTVFSESFMRYFQHTISWIDISVVQDLSEEFIREFQDKVYWNHIYEHQILSESFIKEFKHRVDKAILKDKSITTPRFELMDIT